MHEASLYCTHSDMRVVEDVGSLAKLYFIYDTESYSSCLWHHVNSLGASFIDIKIFQCVKDAAIEFTCMHLWWSVGDPKI